MVVLAFKPADGHDLDLVARGPPNLKQKLKNIKMKVDAEPLDCRRAGAGTRRPDEMESLRRHPMPNLATSDYKSILKVSCWSKCLK